MLRHLFGAALLLLCCFQAAAHADPPSGNRIDVQLKKTFDYDTLVEYTVTASHAGYKAVMIYSQRRVVKDASQLKQAGLSYRPKALNDKPFSPKVQQVLLSAIIHRLHSEFGRDLKLSYFNSSGFLNVQSMEHLNFKAFRHYPPWTAYLKSSAPHLIPQHETYAMVVKRWKEKGVYADVIEVFNTLGYQLRLQGFEKLFAQRADQCAFYNDLQTLGIEPHERFPYPGAIQFSVHKK